MKLKPFYFIVVMVLAISGPIYAESLQFSLALPEDHPVFERVQKLVDEIVIHSGQDIKAKVVYTPNKRSVVNLERGYSDGDLGRSEIVYRGKAYAVMVPEAVLATSYYAFSKKKIAINGWASLGRLNVVVERGDQIARAFLDQKVKSLQIAGDDEAAFMMLSKDRVDAYVGDLISASPVCRKIDCDALGIKILQPAVADVPLYLFLHKKHESLKEDLARAIRQMKQQGRIKEIMAGR